MGINIDEKIKQKVIEENKRVYDWGAKFHTAAVPYQSRIRTRNYIWSLIYEQIKKRGIDPNGKKICEVACGTGTFALFAKKLNAKSYDGFDISGEMIKIAKEEYENKNTKFYKMSLEDYAQEHLNEYDIIISSSFLHHMVDITEGLLQIKNMLKPGGIYIALHELDNTREWTRFEIFDHELSLLFGYQGYARFPLTKRIRDFWKYVWTRMLHHQGLRFGLASPEDFVDYQLRHEFNLSKNAEVARIIGKSGEVIPYCYYHFAELRHIKNIKNHHMLVMVKG